MSAPFHGAKIALVCAGRLVAYRRDDRPGLVNAGRWDLPGGGREGGETPEACALRETAEEFGLAIDAGRIHWRRRYPSTDNPGHRSWFMVAAVTPAEVAGIVFGDEGECWRMMTIDGFLAHPRAVPGLRPRLADYLAGQAA